MAFISIRGPVPAALVGVDQRPGEHTVETAPRRGGGLRREREHHLPAWREQPGELLQVSEREPRAHVLQDDRAVDEVEAAVGELRQVFPLVEHESPRRRPNGRQRGRRSFGTVRSLRQGEEDHVLIVLGAGAGVLLAGLVGSTARDCRSRAGLAAVAAGGAAILAAAVWWLAIGGVA